MNGITEFHKRTFFLQNLNRKIKGTLSKLPYFSGTIKIIRQVRAITCTASAINFKNVDKFKNPHGKFFSPLQNYEK